MNSGGETKNRVLPKTTPQWDTADEEINIPSSKKQELREVPCLKPGVDQNEDPNVLETFQAMIGGKFASLIILNNEDTDVNSIITTFNTVVTETAGEILGKHRQEKKDLGHCRNS